VESAKTDFKEIRPGVSKKILWGNPDVGPYGSFTKFGPGLVNPMHTHSSEIRIVVLKGTYIYTPQNGSEQRVGACAFISVPAGAVHVSSGDAKEGGLFYEESLGKFDLSVVESKSVK
jgi:gentisate 1,2-dioxygenase